MRPNAIQKSTSPMGTTTSTAVGFGQSAASDWESLLAGIVQGKTTLEIGTNRSVYQQGELANSVFYLRNGKVKLAATSEDGKEAIFAILDAGQIFGEGCLAGQNMRTATASALTDCTLIRIDKTAMTTLLRDQPRASDLLVSNLLHRSMRYEEDLVDQLSNTSERRLARSLLLLAHVDNENKAEPVRILPKVNQEMLAQMVGTTRSRVSHFMNKFKQSGFVDYNCHGELLVHSKLFRVVA